MRASWIVTCRAVSGEQAIVAEGEPGGAGRLRAPGLALVGGVPGGQATVSGGDERVRPKREVLDRGGVPKSRALLSVDVQRWTVRSGPPVAISRESRLKAAV